MPRTNQTTVNQGANGQYKTTIPKAFGDAHDLDGKALEWRQVTGEKFEVSIIDVDDAEASA